MAAVPDNPRSTEYRLQRRVSGFHDQRLDGVGDIIFRARDCSVLDLGCNRGLAGFEFACNGAALVHGCDIWEPGIAVAREIFADLPNVESCFVACDLSGGADALRAAFGLKYRTRYDVVLYLATHHKLKRIMPAAALSAFVKHLGEHTERFLVWRGYQEELAELDLDLGSAGLKRVQYSEISETISPSGIWARR